MSMGASLLAKSFNVQFSNVSNLARCSSAFPALRSFGTTTTPVAPPPRGTTPEGGPKRPVNGYMRWFIEKRPFLVTYYPDLKATDLVKKASQQWRMLSPEAKRPYDQAAVEARAHYNVQLQQYKNSLTPLQSELREKERRLRLAKLKEGRRKTELKTLGKPKSTRSAFNLFMSENYTKVKYQPMNLTMRMKSLRNDWETLVDAQKKRYNQLAEDDKVRYHNEMKIWERRMMEMGREDLVRKSSLPKEKKKTTVVKIKRGVGKLSKTSSKAQKKPVGKLSKTSGAAQKKPAAKATMAKSATKATAGTATKTAASLLSAKAKISTPKPMKRS